MAARIVLRAGRLLACTFTLVVVLMQCASALAADCLFVPTDGTFRDASSLSRFERAALLVQRLTSIDDTSVGTAREQLQELHPELQALGIDVSGIQLAPQQWHASRVTVGWDDLDWGQPQAHTWTVNRMTAVDAFWTNPSSPSLRFSMAAESSGRPRIAPPRAERVNFMADWTPPAERDDFTRSTPVEVLPAPQRIAFSPNLGIDFSFSPHRRVVENALPRVVDNDDRSAALSTNVMTLDALARVGLSSTSVATQAVSPVMRPESLRTSTRLPSPDALHPSPQWQWGGSYEASSVLGQGTPQTDMFLASDSASRSFITGSDPLGPGVAWTHYAASGGYPLPVQNLDFNVKFDEWTFGEHTSLNGLGSNRTFGLDRARLQDAQLNLNYNLDPSFSLHGGYIYTRTSGLYTGGLDPNTANLNLTQDRAYPYLGFDYKISTNARWNVNIRFYNTPLDFGTGASTAPRAPLNLTDPQVTTEVKVRF